jgi:hypothetical protein
MPKAPQTRIDMAPEQAVFLKHALQLGLTERKLSEWGVYHEFDLRERLIAKQEQEIKDWDIQCKALANLTPDMPEDQVKRRMRYAANHKMTTLRPLEMLPYPQALRVSEDGDMLLMSEELEECGEEGEEDPADPTAAIAELNGKDEKKEGAPAAANQRKRKAMVLQSSSLKQEYEAMVHSVIDPDSSYAQASKDSYSNYQKRFKALLEKEKLDGDARKKSQDSRMLQEQKTIDDARAKSRALEEQIVKLSKEKESRRAQAALSEAASAPVLSGAESAPAPQPPAAAPNKAAGAVKIGGGKKRKAASSNKSAAGSVLRSNVVPAAAAAAPPKRVRVSGAAANGLQSVSAPLFRPKTKSKTKTASRVVQAQSASPQQQPMQLLKTLSKSAKPPVARKIVGPTAVQIALSKSLAGAKPKGAVLRKAAPGPVPKAPAPAPRPQQRLQLLEDNAEIE